MQNQSPILKLIGLLPEEAKSWVINSLRLDDIIWQSLHDLNFIARVEESSKNDRQFWAPFKLALLAIDDGPTNISDSFSEFETMDSSLVSLGEKAFKEQIDRLSSDSVSPVDKLQQAGLIALYLNDLYNNEGTLVPLISGLAQNNVSALVTPLKCVFGMVEDKGTFLSNHFIRNENPSSLYLSLEVIFGNPATDDKYLEYLLPLFVSLDKPSRIPFLTMVSAYSQSVTNLLQIEMNDVLETGDTYSNGSQILYRLLNIDANLYKTIKVSTTGIEDGSASIQKNLLSVSDSIQDAFAYFQTRLAISLGDGSNPELADRYWKSAIEHSREKETYLSLYGLTLLQAGKNKGARVLIDQNPDTTTDNDTISSWVVRAILTLDDSNENNAIMYAKHAVSCIIKQKGTTLDPIAIYEIVTGTLQLSKLFNKIVLPLERLSTISHALSVLPTHPKLIQELGAAYHDAGDYASALETLNLLLLSKPDCLHIYKSLFEVSKKAHYWESALSSKKHLLSHSKINNLADQLDYAGIALRLGDNNLTREICESVLELDPNNSFAHALLGEAYAGIGNMPASTLHFNKASSQEPCSPQYYLSKSRVCLQAGDEEGARSILTHAVNRQVENPDLFSKLGKIHCEDGNFSQALQLFQESYNKDHDNPDALLDYAKVLSLLGHKERSSELWMLGNRKFPLHPEIAINTATLFENQGDTDHAIRVLQHALFSLNKDPKILKKYGQILLSHSNSIDQAISLFSDAIQINPDDDELPGFLAEAFKKKGDYHKAHQLYSAALDKAPANSLKNVSLITGFSETLVQLGRVEEAVSNLKLALTRDPDNIELLKCLTDVHTTSGNSLDAIESSKSVLNANRDSVDTLQWYADQAMKVGENGEALSALTRAHKLAGNRYDIIIALGDAQSANGNSKSAKNAYKQAASYKVFTTKDLIDLSNGLSNLGEYKESINYLEQAISMLSTPSSDLIIKLVDLHIKTVQYDLAIDILDKAISNTPDVPDFYFKKAQIYLAINRQEAARRNISKGLLEVNRSEKNEVIHAIDALRLYGHSKEAYDLADIEYCSNPNNAASCYQKADLSRSMLRFDDGKKALDHPVQGDPQDMVHYHCLAAELYLLENDIPRAAQHSNAATQIHPFHPRCLAIQSRINLKNGEMDLAKTQLSSSVHTLKHYKSSAQNRLSCISSVADACLESDQFDLAISYYSNLCEQLPNDSYCQLNLAKSLVLQAEAQHLYTELDIVTRFPGRSIKDPVAIERFESALAKSRLTQSCKTSLSYLAYWQIRGKAAFNPTLRDIRQFEKVAVIPEDAALIISAYRRIGEFKKGLEFALREDYDAAALIQLSLLYGSANGHDDEALSTAKKANEKEPNSAIINFMISRIAYKLNHSDLSIEKINKANDIWPDEPKWHILASDIYLSVGDIEIAIQHVQDAVRLEPGNYSHTLLLGKLYHRMGDHSQSIAVLKQSIQTGTDEYSPRLALSEVLNSLHQTTSALDYADQAIALAPELASAKVHKAKILLEFNKINKTREALQLCNQAIRIEPQLEKAFLYKAKAQLILKKYNDSLSTIEQALSFAKDTISFSLLKAELLKRVKNRKSQIEYLIKLSDDVPNEPNILIALARAYSEAGQDEEAIQTSQAALKLITSDADSTHLINSSKIHLLLGRLLRKSGQLDQALQILTEGVASNNDPIEYYLELGQTYIDRREYDSALRIYEKARSEFPSNYRSYYDAAMVYKDAKDYQNAEIMLRTAHELAPNDLNVSRQLAVVIALNLVHNPSVSPSAV